MADGKPDHIGRYKILDELGRGGFGRVYRAYDPTVGRQVAVKIMTHVGKDMLTRFRNEAIVAGNLRHENIVTVYEFGTHDDFPFLAMEYLEGEDLHEIIASRRPLTLLDRCRIMLQVAEGLHCAHKNGVIHRDVKPANIMVLRDGTVKIMDFGIARLTNNPEAARLTLQGHMIGTLPYMAPEQLAGADCDALCDIFAYGVIFYELVTGRHPFQAPDAPSMMYKLTFDTAAPVREFAPDVPEALEAVVARLIHRDRDARYQTLKDVQFDIEPIRIDLQREVAAALLIQAQDLFKKEQLEPAQKVLREALELDPTNRTARALRDDLRKHLQQRTLQPRIEASLSAGEEHLAQRRFREAELAFDSALRLDRDNPYIQSRIEQARTLLEHAKMAAQLLARARREFERQNLTPAYRTVSEALRHDPENPEAAEFLKTIQAFIARRQAEVLRESEAAAGDFEAAAAALDAVRREATNGNAATRNRRAEIASVLAKSQALRSQKRVAEACDVVAAALQQFKDEPELRGLLDLLQEEQAREQAIATCAAEARACFEAGEWDGALALLDEGLQDWPDAAPLLQMRDAALAERERRRIRARAIQDLHDIQGRAPGAAASERSGFLAEAQRIAAQHAGDQEIAAIAAEAIRLLSDLELVRREIAAANFRAAAGICDRHMAEYPAHSVFAELKDEADRAEARAYLEEVRRRCGAEQDIRKRAVILEQALERYPGEPSLASELRLVSDKLRLIDSIVEEARGLEKAEKWDEALDKWKSLLPLDDGYPGLKAELGRVQRSRNSARRRAASREKPRPPRDRKWLLVAAGALAAALAGVAVILLSRGPAPTTVAITANAPHTSVTVAGKSCVTPGCTLDLAPGTYLLHASADGYKDSTRQITVTRGRQPGQLALTLEPLPQLLQVNANFDRADVYLDGRPAGQLRDGQFAFSGIAPGTHILRIAGDGADFQAEWRSTPGSVPEISKLAPGKDLQATVIANAGAAGHIACNCVADSVTVDGVRTAGAVSDGRSVALNGLKPGPRQIALGGRVMVIDVRSNPALNVFLGLDRNRGALIVATGQDGVSVFLNNELYKRKTEHGIVRIPVDVGNYTVRVEKDGFSAAPPQTVEVKKGEDKQLTYALAPAAAYLAISGALPEAQVRVDGRTIGETDRNGALRHEIAAGQHTIELVKDKYTPVQLTEQFKGGGTVQLNGAQVSMKAAQPPPPDPKEIEAQDWARVANSTDPDEFELFIRNHPGGAHLPQARSRAAELRQQKQASAAQQLDGAAWDKVDQNSKEQLRDYLSRFPSGLHSQQASARLAELAKQAAELAAQRLKEQTSQEQSKRAAEEQAITAVLKEFEAAYNRRDIGALQSLWSGVPVAVYRQEFKDAKDLKFQLQPAGEITVNGGSASVVCTRTLAYQGRSGGRQTHSERVTVTLSREPSGWVIRSINGN